MRKTCQLVSRVRSGNPIAVCVTQVVQLAIGAKTNDVARQFPKLEGTARLGQGSKVTRQAVVTTGLVLTEEAQIMSLADRDHTRARIVLERDLEIIDPTAPQTPDMITLGNRGTEVT